MMIFKRSLIFFLFISLLTGLSAQKKLTPEYVESYFWGSEDPMPKGLTVPEKWKNESAVILFQEYNFKFENSGKKVNQVEALRRRIKLQDKAAVDQYSEFSYQEKFDVSSNWNKRVEKVFAGFKIIKPNGEEQIVDVNTAVRIEGTEDYQRKIAIPGLEEGDMIDYYFYSFNPSIYQSMHAFDPVYTPLSGEYPIKEQRITFEVERKFFVAFNSYHDAPELKLVSGPKDKLDRYSLVDKDRDKIETTRWFYPYRVLPSIKFQVTFARSNFELYQLKANLKAGETIKKEIDGKEVMDAYEYNFVPGKFENKKLAAYLAKKNLSLEKDKLKTLEAVFNYLRTTQQVYASELRAVNQAGGLKASDSYAMQYGSSYFKICKEYASYLKTNKIDFQLLIGVPRHYGEIQEVLFFQELFILLYIPEFEMYVAPVSEHAPLASYPAFMEGVETYTIPFARRKSSLIKNHFVVLSGHEDNSTFQRSVIEIGEDMNSLSIKRVNTSWGHLKTDEQNRYLVLSDILSEDYAEIGKAKYLDEVKLKKDLSSQAKLKFKANAEEELEAQKELFKATLEDELDLEVPDYLSYEITSTGRKTANEAFSYKESFLIKEDLIQKAGPNLILEIGRFIGGQVALEKEEIDRTEDVYLDHARSFDNEIVLSIPEGYKVVGLDKLTYNIENESGGFVSSAKVEGGKLLINTKKFYKHTFEEAKDWPLMVEFLEAAYKFSQEKVLLKKAS
ncbi:MAG: hypothetical protein R8P61_01565 [Bacteroidia bacterium]|nr:hypothetical protein [Bacteroidia bacterium]